MTPGMILLHVFQEDSAEDQADHLEYWFGFPELHTDYFRDLTVMCHCGGRMAVLKRDPRDASNVTLGAVWHELHYAYDEATHVLDEDYDE